MTSLHDIGWQRHQLVRLSHHAWQLVLRSRSDAADADALREWARHDWPLIVRRPNPGEPAGVPLGVPLPPSKGKRRLTLVVAHSDIVSTSCLPTLSEVAATAPTSWRSCLQVLDALEDTYALKAGVYGSLAWQYLTGMPYLSDASDLDVAWSFPIRQQLNSFLDDLADVEAHAPMRIDGELLRPDGAGVNWRELRSDLREVAVKTFHAVQLQPRATFMATLP